MAFGLGMSAALPALSQDVLASFENRFTERCPDYAQIGRNTLDRPLVTPWPPKADWRFKHNARGNYNRRDRNWPYRPENRSRDRHDEHRDRRDRDRDNDRRSDGSYNNHRRYGHRREPYRDLDDVKEQKTKYEKEQDEVEKVEKYLQHYRRNVLEKGDKTDSPVKSDSEAPAVKSSSSILSSKPGFHDMVSTVLGHSGAGSGPGASSVVDKDAAGLHMNSSAVDKYRVKKGSAHPAGGATHQPLPYQLAHKQPEQGTVKRRPGHRAAGTTAAPGAAAGAEKQRKVNLAAAARSRRAISEAVKAASGKSKAGAATASLAKYAAGTISPKKAPSSPSQSSHPQTAVHSPPKPFRWTNGITDGQRRGSASSAASSPEHGYAVASGSDNETSSQPKDEALPGEEPIMWRVPVSYRDPSPQDYSEADNNVQAQVEPQPVIIRLPQLDTEGSLKLRVHLNPGAVELHEEAERAKKHHKKHKKHKRHHNNPEAGGEPSCKRTKQH